MTAAVISPHPAADRATRPQPGSDEDRFMKLLQALGYDVQYECDSFTVPRWRRSNRRWIDGEFTPDLCIVGRFGESFPEATYLELTQADMYTNAFQLPLLIRQKNRHSSHSRKPYISPDEYLARKRKKIAKAVHCAAGSGTVLRVALLTSVEQSQLLQDSSALIDLIDHLRIA